MGLGGFIIIEINRILIVMESILKLFFFFNDKYRKCIIYYGGCNVYLNFYIFIIL